MLVSFLLFVETIKVVIQQILYKKKGYKKQFKARLCFGACTVHANCENVADPI